MPPTCALTIGKIWLIKLDLPTPDCPTKMDVPSLKSAVNFSIFFPVSAEMMMV